MSSLTVTLMAFACVFGGAVVGMFLQNALPEHHLSPASKETVNLGIGLVATMSALVLGLLVSSAKTSYDTQSAELNQLSADVVFLDRLLAQYGPETKEARDTLRGDVVSFLDRVWSGDPRQAPEVVTRSRWALLDQINALSPKDDSQRSLKAQALGSALSLGRTRLLMYEQGVLSVSKPLLVIVVFWLTIVFFSFGLFATRNLTTIISLCAAGLAVSGAILLILDMYTPYRGLIQISSAPVRSALEHLGQ